MTLVIDRLVLRRIRVPFRFAFEHAARARKEADHLVVELRTADGHSGFGEILPRDYLSGETLASCREDVEALWWPLLARLEIPRATPPFAALAPLYERADAARRTASYAGIDVAVFDLWARAAGIPLADVLGGAPRSLPLTAPIGFGMPASIVARAARFYGFETFKVKIGDAVSLSRAAAVARATGGRPLVLDANGQSSVGTTIALAASLKAVGIEVAAWEEPLGRGDLGGLSALRKSGLTLMADESVVTRADAAVLSANGAVTQWNLRLAKNGGFSGLRALAGLAAKCGAAVQLGALVGETSCSGAAAFPAAALILAATGRLPLRCEASFPAWLLRQDPFTGGPVVRKGALTRTGDGAGLGVTPARLDQATVETLTLSR